VGQAGKHSPQCTQASSFSDSFSSAAFNIGFSIQYSMKNGGRRKAGAEVRNEEIQVKIFMS
jgi:hypothetical protein